MRRRLRRFAIAGAALLAVAALASLTLALALRPPSAPVPPRGARLEGVTLVEPGVARTPGRTVVVEGDRIARVEPAGASVPAGERFLLPGLVDLHVHHPSAFTAGERELFALLFLRHGVTTVRDTGELIGSLEPHRRAIATGRRAGPRVFRCGPVVDGVPRSWPGAYAVRGAEAARAVVRELAADGVDCIKAYNNLDAGTLAALRRAAEEVGLPLLGHLPFEVDFRDARVMEIQHLMGLTQDWSSLPEGRLRRYVEHSRAAGVSHTPTLVAFERFGRLDRLGSLRADPALGWLPRYYAEVLWDPARNPLVQLQSPEASADARDRFETMKRALPALRDAGVRLSIGTDAMNAFSVPGAGLHAELRAWVDAGFGAEEVWAIATRGAGEVLGVPGLGRLEPGAPADLLLFREDPSRDLAALGTLEAVVADGRLYPRAALDEALERQRRHFRGALYEAVTLRAARVVTGVMGRVTH